METFQNTVNFTPAQDYYPGGSLMPGRSFSSNSYRFEFNGQEKDDEIFGSTGTSYNFKFRMYDSRVGRFWRVDPLAKEYPWNSTYAFAENDVIRAKELEGGEKLIVNINAETGKQTMIELPKAGFLGDGILINVTNANGDVQSIYQSPTIVTSSGDNTPGYTTDVSFMFNNLAKIPISSPGEIKPADNLTSFEMWLETPSESIGGNIGKIGANNRI